MVKADIRLGLTPAFKRIAYHYLLRGVGTHVPVETPHPHYSKVVVRELYEFRENPHDETAHAGGVVVEFFREDRKVRWVEFRCSPVGGGGTPLIRAV